MGGETITSQVSCSNKHTCAGIVIRPTVVATYTGPFGVSYNTGNMMCPTLTTGNVQVCMECDCPISSGHVQCVHYSINP